MSAEMTRLEEARIEAGPVRMIEPGSCASRSALMSFQRKDGRKPYGGRLQTSVRQVMDDLESTARCLKKRERDRRFAVTRCWTSLS
jgi:hypothetical protein